MMNTGSRTVEPPQPLPMDSTPFAATRRPMRTERPQRLSRLLRQISERPEETISYASLVELFGDRAFGAVMLVFGLLTTLAVIPGSSALTAAPILLVATQLSLGRRVLWLPQKVAVRELKIADLKRLTDRIMPHLRRAERIMAPRLSFIFGPVGDRVIGIICLILAVLIFLPIPGGNLFPGLAVAGFSLALLRHDGLAAILAMILAIVSVGVLIALYGAVFVGLKELFLAALRWFS